MMRMSYRLLLIVFVPPLVVLVAVALANIVFGVSIPSMTRDVAAIAQVHPLTGVLSNLGILLWWASASIWLFTASLLNRQRWTYQYQFALSSGLLSAYLALDDLFLIHESLAPTYLGIPEVAIFAALALSVFVYLWVFRRTLLQEDGVLLIIGLGFLACSMALDSVLEPWVTQLGQWSWFLEDGTKWMGIAGWCGFCIARCRQGSLAMSPDVVT